MKLKIRKIIYTSICFPCLLNSVNAANEITNAIAISAGQTAVAVTSGVIMKNMGMQPQFVSTPTGIVAVPTDGINNSNNPNQTPVDTYAEQNDQSGKKAFFDGAYD
jgi:hypothetical protein